MTPHVSSTTWHLERLPPVRVALVRLIAEERASLPPLPTTSLHGALEPELETLCDPVMPAHRELVEGAAPSSLVARDGTRPAGPRGVTNASPRPWTVAPTAPMGTDESLELAPGDLLTLRLAMIGERAHACEGLLLAALGRAATRGLGIRPHREGRPRLRLDGVTPLTLPPRTVSTPRRVLLDCTTPLRIKRDGEFLDELDPTSLWRTLVRRAQTLALAYGGGPITERAPDAPFTITRDTSRRVPVRRWSSHHRTRMLWTGLQGVWQVHAREDAPPSDLDACWRLLTFAESVQIGSATGFGFGSVTVTALG